MDKSRRAAASKRRASKTAITSVLDRSQTGRRNESASGAADLLREEAANRLTGRATGAPPVSASRRAHAGALTETVGLLTNNDASGGAPRDALRPALLAGAAACALSLAAAPSPAQAQVIVNTPGTIPDPQCEYDDVTNSLGCEGDLSDGIDISTDGSAPLEEATIDNLTGTIAPGADEDGVLFRNTYDGDTTLTVDVQAYGITTSNYAGIRAAKTGGADGNLTVNVAGGIAVTGSGEVASGILAAHFNDGDLSVVARSDIDVANNSGIDAFVNNGALSVDSTGRITAGQYGIFASSETGVASVTSNGDITTTDGDGIVAYGSSTTTVISTGNITAGDDGLQAASDDAGATIESAGTIRADDDGIFAAGNTSASVTSTGNIYAGDDGIVTTASDGDASVKSTGTIEAYDYGISARSTQGSAYVTSGGDIEVSYEGGVAIYAYSESAGGVTIVSDGDLKAEGANAFGIRAETAYRTGDISIESTGDITAGFGGVTATALVETYVSGGAQVYAGGNVDVISNGAVSAGSGYGVIAEARKGDVTITSVGAVSSDTRDAIKALAGNFTSGATRSGGVTINSTGAVSGGKHGIYAYGYDAVSVSSKGDVTGQDGAIYAYSYDSEVTVYSYGALKAYGDNDFGIRAFAQNNAASVESIGSITASGDEARGIYVRGRTDDEVKITSDGAVFAGGAGLIATVLEGAGDAVIESVGAVTSVNGNGIVAGSNGGGVRITSDGDVTGNAYAIFAAKSASGDGDIEVNSSGDLKAAMGGVAAFVEEEGAITIVSEGAVTVSNNQAIAIDAYNRGGDIKINSDGTIKADEAFSQGIVAKSADGDIEIVSTGDVMSQNIAISGSSSIGDVSIDSVGAVSSVFGFGLLAGAEAGDATIRSAGDVSGSDVAISAASGGGAVSVTSVGKVVSSGEGVDTQFYIAGAGYAPASIGYGILAAATDGPVSIVSDGAVEVESDGDGTIGIMGQSANADVVINSTGSVSALGAFGGGVGGRTLTGNVEIVSTGPVTAAAAGLFGFTVDDGDVSISSNGVVTAAGNDSGIPYLGGTGVLALALGAGDVVVNADGTITAKEEGILARAATGDVSVTSGAAVASSDSAGIRAVGATGVEIESSGDVAAATDGIYAAVTDEGDIEIDLAGAVTTSGADSVGVHVLAAAGSSNAVTIGADGAVTGGSGAGAGVRFTDGATNRLENRGTIAALSGVAVEGAAGVETVVNYGVLEGAVSLAAGDDVFELYDEGDVSAADLDGGEGVDTFRLAGTGVGVLSVGGLESFEIFEKTGAGTWGLVDDYVFATSASLLEGVLDLQGTLTSPIVTNSGGSLAVGGVGIVGTGTIDGNYVQEAGGDYQIDVDFQNGAADLLSVAGTAALAGTVTANVSSFASGEQDVTILTAAGGATDNGLALNAFSPSPLVDASLAFPNDNDVVLSVIIAFAPEGVDLNEDQAVLAASLETAFNAGAADGGLSDVFSALLFDIDSNTAYLEALNELTPDVVLSTQTVSLFAAEAFSDGLFSCADKADVRAVSREGECLWLKVSGGVLDVDGEARSTSFDDETVSVSAGWQGAVAEHWRIGVAAGYETSSLENAVGATSDGDRLMAGVSVKHLRGPLRLSAAVSGGVGDYDTTRPVSFGGFSDTLLSEQDVAHVAAQARLAYQKDFAGWYAQPFVDVNWTWVSLGDATESGGAAALAIDGEDETFFSVTPGLELGADLVLSESFALRPFLRAGASYYTGNTEFGLSARFVGGPSGDVGFANVSAIDDLYADVQAGVTLFNIRSKASQGGGRFGELGSRAAISIVYEGRHGENTKQNSAFIKAAFPF